MERLSRALRALVKHLKDSRGVSLYEITAAVAMTGILAAVAVPVIIDKVSEAKSARAIQEVDGIYKAMQAFQKDTGKLPGQAEGAVLLKSGGVMPGGVAGSVGVRTAALCGPGGAVTSTCLLLDRFLVGPLSTDDATNYPGWKGPYIDPISGDPFERAYIVNVQALYKVDTPLAGCGFGWVLSGGPNRELETHIVGDNAVPLTSDDLGRNYGKKTLPGPLCTANPLPAPAG
jgi:type II secretory pathway pseudopilin PulG